MKEGWMMDRRREAGWLDRCAFPTLSSVDHHELSQCLHPASSHLLGSILQ